MRGQVFLEFLVAFIITLAVIETLAQSQEKALASLARQINQSSAKMEAEGVASACSLLYFNWKSAEFNFTFNLSNFAFDNNTIIIESVGENISAECISEIGGSGVLEVSGVRRWF